jgi:hypothetical protein
MAPRRSLVMTALALLALPCVAAAQFEAGGRVRLGIRKDSTVGKERLTGVVEALEQDALTLQVKGQGAVLVPYGDILKVEASRGRSAKSGAGRGALFGIAVGVIAGLAQGSDQPGIVAFSAGEKALFFGILGAPVGAAIGAVVGVERWERVEPARVRLGFLPVRGGAGVAVSVGFSGRGRR